MNACTEDRQVGCEEAMGVYPTAVSILENLVPRLCLGTHCTAGSAGLPARRSLAFSGLRGGASRSVGYEAEPRNQSDSRILDDAKMFTAVGHILCHRQKCSPLRRAGEKRILDCRPQGIFMP